MKNPNLRSLTLDNNEISDDGLTRLASSLKKNNKLAHISFKDCPLITDEGINNLYNVLVKENTVLFSVNFDSDFYTEKLSK